MLFPIDYAGEGLTDAVLARRLISEAGGIPGRDYVTGFRARGKDALDSRLPGLLIAAQHGQRLLVLRDLDTEPCAVVLVRRLVPEPLPTFCLRIAVREAEAWLIADRDGLARALGVAASCIPRDPEALPDPKNTLRQIAADARNRLVRTAFAGSAQQAQGWIAEFIQTKWSPHSAREYSISLDTTLRRLAALAHR
jgi:hypothetical protein